MQLSSRAAILFVAVAAAVIIWTTRTEQGASSEEISARIGGIDTRSAENPEQTGLTSVEVNGPGDSGTEGGEARRPTTGESVATEAAPAPGDDPFAWMKSASVEDLVAYKAAVRQEYRDSVAPKLDDEYAKGHYDVVDSFTRKHMTDALGRALPNQLVFEGAEKRLVTLPADQYPAESAIFEEIIAVTREIDSRAVTTTGH